MNGTEILVTGGTGILGSRVVGRLRSAGTEPPVLSRSGRPGLVKGNLLTGEGMAEAVSSVDTVVHCASSPFWKARQTDVEGTRRLLDAAYRAGVSHLVYISIVGIDRAQSYPYYRVKLETERVVESSPVPYTILRATQFYDLVLMAVRALSWLPVVPVPKDLVGQPIDAGEVADRMVELALSEPAGRVEDVGGPEVRTVEDIVHSYLKLTESRKKTVALRLPGETARAIRGGALTCPDNRYGKVRWEEFLREAVDPRYMNRETLMKAKPSTVRNEEICFPKAALVEPAASGQILLAAEIDRRPPFLPHSRWKRALIAACKRWCRQLEADPSVPFRWLSGQVPFPLPQPGARGHDDDGQLRGSLR